MVQHACIFVVWPHGQIFYMVQYALNTFVVWPHDQDNLNDPIYTIYCIFVFWPHGQDNLHDPIWKIYICSLAAWPEHFTWPNMHNTWPGKFTTVLQRHLQSISPWKYIKAVGLFPYVSTRKVPALITKVYRKPTFSLQIYLQFRFSSRVKAVV